MKATHRGYRIEVKRERCLGGWEMLYYTITRIRDRWICLEDFEDSAETEEAKVEQLKARIDAELAEPNWRLRWQ